MRRVGSIAIVHETLSHAPEEIVDFDDVAERVAMMAGEVSAPEARVTPELLGQFGLLPSAVATPLALVLTELLQNALQHGLTRPTGAGAGGTPRGHGSRQNDRLTVTVADNGAGLPTDFDLDSTTSLGLQIVRTLVVAELGGRLEIAPQAAGGTKVLVDLPVEPHAATDAARIRRAVAADDGRRAGQQPPSRRADRQPRLGRAQARPQAWRRPGPWRAALERAPLVFAHAAPDPRVLAALKRPLQACLHALGIVGIPAWPRRSGAARALCCRSGRTAPDPRHGRRRGDASP